MRSVDTNVVVRLLMDDDVAQAARVRRLFDEGNLFISVTVLLETEWVLRSLYRRTAAAIIAELRRLLGLPKIVVEDATRVAVALDWAAAGMDLADAFHLARAADCTTFFTFDRRLIKAAIELGGIAVVEP